MQDSREPPKLSKPGAPMFQFSTMILGPFTLSFLITRKSMGFQIQQQLEVVSGTIPSTPEQRCTTTWQQILLSFYHKAGETRSL
ncbi:transmembrane protein, putative [Rhizoctonia solani AG-3 Rhs1AP]|uniref:Transmembrane protein, putative n=1 Tax=Rhizoctonia solani AG-3 Rhs1AP TaxID=1086054 RepID=X8JJW1_9AGAM|nr:transmembrane protein, putative [Rhizoctonia solani AG-3 Rhs1AP]